jgi:hypothetical protein
MAGLELTKVLDVFSRQDWLALAKGSYHKMVAAGGGARLQIRGWKPDVQMIAIKRGTRNDIVDLSRYFFDDRCPALFLRRKDF